MISVIIPCRNRLKYLKNCIDSIIKQTFIDWEVIVVDYGSDTRCTEEFIKSLNSYRIRCIYVDEKGRWNLSRARNIGLRHAKGEFIISLDADMIIADNVLERVWADFKERKQPVLYQIHRRDILLDGSIKLYEPQKEFGGVFLGAFQACSKASWLQVRGFDERLDMYGWEDGDLAVRMRRIGVEQYWMPLDVKIYHQYHPSSPGNETYINMIRSKLNRSHLANDENWGSAEKKGDAPRRFDKFLIWAVIKPIKAIKRWMRTFK